jgi:hypothetical protein
MTVVPFFPDAMPPRRRPRLHRTTDVRIRELVAAD